MIKHLHADYPEPDTISPKTLNQRFELLIIDLTKQVELLTTNVKLLET